MHTIILHNMLCYIFFLLILLLSALNAQAETYYLSLSGNDANSGTSRSNPWATIAKVNTMHFEPGDSILFEGGSTFEGGIYIQKGNKGEVSKIAGTAEKPIVFSSYGTGRAIISSGKIAGLKVYNAAGFKIEKLIFKGAGRTINESFGVEFYMDVAGKLLEYVYIDSVEVFGYREAGIAFTSWEQTTGGFKDISITNSTSHDNGDAGIITYAQGSAITHENVYIGYNKAYNNSGLPDKWWNHSGSGIIVGGANGAIIEYCEAYNNGWLNNYSNSGPIGIWGYNSNNLIIQFNESHNNKTNSRTDGGGFDIDGGCTGCIMQYNYSHDNDGAGYVIAQYKNAPPMSNVIVRYNISENDARKNNYGSMLIWGHSSGEGFKNAEIYNNTIYITPSSHGSPSAIFAELNSSKGVKIRNNIIIAKGNVKLLNIQKSKTQDIRFESNNYWSIGNNFSIGWNGRTYTSLSEWRDATGQETLNGKPTGFSIDPHLKNPGHGVIIGNPTKLHTLIEYELEESSELLVKGLDLRKEFGTDIGYRDFFGNSLEGLKEFSLGAYQPIVIIPLPVTLTSFTATRHGEMALLKWETASEQDNQGFSVEVALDGSTFFPIGFVASKAATTSIPQSYSFQDTEPGKQGIRYYRLRQIDLDGTSTYSLIRALSFNTSTVVGLNAYPNPFKSELTLDVVADRDEQMTVNITDQVGRLISNTSHNLRTGHNSLRLSLPKQYPAGLYYLTARYGNVSYRVKLLSQSL